MGESSIFSYRHLERTERTFCETAVLSIGTNGIEASIHCIIVDEIL